jgi:hypothetical protein
MLPGTLTSALGRFPSVVRVKPSGFLSAIHYPYFLHSAFWYYDLSNIISNVEKGSVFYLSHKKLVIFFIRRAINILVQRTHSKNIFLAVVSLPNMRCTVRPSVMGKCSPDVRHHLLPRPRRL